MFKQIYEIHPASILLITSWKPVLNFSRIKTGACMKLDVWDAPEGYGHHTSFDF